MSKLQLRRGTDAERLLVTPDVGELIYTTDTKLVYVGDSTTVGGNIVTNNAGVPVVPSSSPGNYILNIAANGVATWITDLNEDVPNAPTATSGSVNYELQVESDGTVRWIAATGGGSGEINTNSDATAPGTNEAGLVNTKSGVDTPIKIIKGGTNITVTQNTNDVTIDASGSSEATLLQTESNGWIPGTPVAPSTNINISNSQIGFTTNLNQSGGAFTIVGNNTIRFDAEGVYQIGLDGFGPRLFIDNTNGAGRIDVGLSSGSVTNSSSRVILTSGGTTTTLFTSSRNRYGRSILNVGSSGNVNFFNSTAQTTSSGTEEDLVSVSIGDTLTFQTTVSVSGSGFNVSGAIYAASIVGELFLYRLSGVSGTTVPSVPAAASTDTQYNLEVDTSGTPNWVVDGGLGIPTLSSFSAANVTNTSTADIGFGIGTFLNTDSSIFISNAGGITTTTPGIYKIDFAGHFTITTANVGDIVRVNVPTSSTETDAGIFRGADDNTISGTTIFNKTDTASTTLSPRFVKNSGAGSASGTLFYVTITKIG